MIPSEALAAARLVSVENEIARRGIKLRGHVERVGPCPICGGHDRFAINTRKQSWNCRGCAKGGGVIDLVQHLDGVGFPEAVEILTGETTERPQARAPARPIEPDQPDDYEQRQARKTMFLWLQRARIEGSPVERYLREVRKYTGPLLATLGFLPPSKPEHHPCMIAAFGLVDEPEPGILGQPRKGSFHRHLDHRSAKLQPRCAVRSTATASPLWDLPAVQKTRGGGGLPPDRARLC